MHLKALTKLAHEKGTWNLVFVFAVSSCKELSCLNHLNYMLQINAFKWNLNTCSGRPVDFRFSADDCEEHLMVLFLSSA